MHLFARYGEGSGRITLKRNFGKWVLRMADGGTSTEPCRMVAWVLEGLNHQVTSFSYLGRAAAQLVPCRLPRSRGTATVSGRSMR